MTLQWSIFHAILDPTIGHEQAGERPVLVVSAEPLNERYDVIIAVPLTSRKSGRLPRLGEVLLPAGVGGLKSDSFALCYQLRTLDKSRLAGSYGTITEENYRADILAVISECLDLGI